MKLALVIPTRGVIFARTIQSTILSPELPASTTVHIVSGLPIPDAHNECISRALKTDCTHIWFVEEDMEVPVGALTAMIQSAKDGNEYVAIDYPVAKDALSTIFYDDGKALWTGFGCTMFSRRLFEEVEPLLTSKYAVNIKQMHPFKYKVIDDSHRLDRVYGHYDIWFGLQMQKKGIPITVIPNTVCKHLRMSSWERKTTNNGVHDIYEVGTT